MREKKVKGIKIKMTPWTRAAFILTFVIFALYAISLIFPFFFTFVNSFKTNLEFRRNIWSFPKNFKFSNYTELFTENDMLSMFINSIILTAGGTFVSLLSGAVMAYVLSKYRFPGSRFIYLLAITFMLIPNLGTVSAVYKLVVNLKFIDNIFLVLLLYAGPFGSTFLLLYSFFQGISWSYAEAAKIDGAGNFTVFFRIMLPQARAGIGAVAFMVAIGNWNDYFTPYMYLPSMYTVATGLQNMSVNAETTGAYTELFAAMIVATLPILIVFAFLQKTIMENTIAGGLKG